MRAPWQPPSSARSRCPGRSPCLPWPSPGAPAGAAVGPHPGSAAGALQGRRRRLLAPPQHDRLLRHHGPDRGALEGSVQRLSDLAADSGQRRLSTLRRRNHGSISASPPRCSPPSWSGSSMHAHHARLQDQGHRREPGGGALCRHQGRPRSRRRRDHLRRACRPCRRRTRSAACSSR